MLKWMKWTIKIAAKIQFKMQPYESAFHLPIWIIMTPLDERTMGQERTPDNGFVLPQLLNSISLSANLRFVVSSMHDQMLWSDQISGHRMSIYTYMYMCIYMCLHVIWSNLDAPPHEAQDTVCVVNLRGSRPTCTHTSTFSGKVILPQTDGVVSCTFFTYM